MGAFDDIVPGNGRIARRAPVVFHDLPPTFDDLVGPRARRGIPTLRVGITPTSTGTHEPAG